MLKHINIILMILLTGCGLSNASQLQQAAIGLRPDILSQPIAINDQFVLHLKESNWTLTSLHTKDLLLEGLSDSNRPLLFSPFKNNCDKATRVALMNHKQEEQEYCYSAKTPDAKTPQYDVELSSEDKSKTFLISTLAAAKKTAINVAALCAPTQLDFLGVKWDLLTSQAVPRVAIAAAKELGIPHLTQAVSYCRRYIESETGEVRQIALMGFSVGRTQALFIDQNPDPKQEWFEHIAHFSRLSTATLQSLK